MSGPPSVEGIPFSFNGLQNIKRIAIKVIAQIERYKSIQWNRPTNRLHKLKRTNRQSIIIVIAYKLLRFSHNTCLDGMTTTAEQLL